MFSLRPYQEQWIEDIGYEFSAGRRRVLAVAPCGAGKTVMTRWMAPEKQKERRPRRH